MQNSILAIDLNKQREAIMSHYKKAALELGEVGRILLETQLNLGNEKTFNAFIETLPFSRSSAFNFIRIHQHIEKYGSPTVGLENIRIASWYIAPPENEELVQAMVEKSKTGKVTPNDVRALLSTVNIEDDRTALAWHGMAEQNPRFIVETIARGAITDFDGNDVPIDEAEPSLIQYQALQDKHEREMRHRTHLEEAKKAARDERNALVDHAATIAEFSPQIEEKPSYKLGDVVKLGNHILFCADNTSEQARDLIQSLGKVELIFCDPPYNAGAAAYDDGSFEWSQDYLAEMADIVAVTPGISSIQSFMKKTEMPYKWSTSAFIANGMTRGALGFGNWIYTALFSKQGSIHRNRQDVYTITIGGKQLDMGDKKQKPSQYLAWLFELLSTKGAWIVDAFGGSGNSVIVAHELGRKCLIIERDVETFNQMVANVSAHIEDELELAAA